jgi:hypothetical protein
MAAMDVVFGVSPWVRLLPLTMTDGQATALGTKMDLIRAVSAKPAFPNLNSDTEQAYLTTEGANNNRYSVPDNSKHYNVMDGNEINDDAGGDSVWKFDVDTLYTATQRKTILDLHEAGTPVIASREIGKNATSGAVAGYEYICGKITDLVDDQQSGPSKLQFSITGEAVTVHETAEVADFDETDYNAAATGASNTITPDNEAARTITDLVTDDWTRLLTGKIVTKNAA